ncbi:MAG: DUF1738 domain-containing protein, partial [Alphaproteobacteria bacterium]|nr:DUF1738 domain-containing protein [Alphaproteobacteria bacterium]
MADELEQQAAAAQAGQEPQALAELGGAGEQAPSSPAEKKQRDLRQEITDRMVQSLERGEIPWERPWENLEHGLPRNMATGNAYKGGNRLLLQLVQMDQGYADPRFGTVKQINELGGRVQKGEKGHPIELWKDQPFWERRDVDISLNGMRVKVFDEGKGVVHVGMPTDKVSTLAVKAADLTVRHKGRELAWGAAHRQLDSVVGRVYTVFNAEQCTGLKIEPLKTPDNKIPVVDRAEQLMTAMREDGVRFATHPQHAFYSPKRDEVSLPPRESFKSVEGYYGTALHEIGHATGAQQRLNREGITGGHRFGSEAYAKEELRAELFSTFMAAETGIPHDEEQHKAYVQSWAKVLKQDKNEIFRAASEAGKAVDYVLTKEQDLLQKIDRIYGKLVGPDTANLSKAPHELTFAEFAGIAHAEKLGPGHGRQWEVFYGRKSLGFADGTTIEGAYRQAHQREVNNALYDNQPGAFRPQDVPAKTMPPLHVWAEYPDLQTKFAEVIAQSQPAGAKTISNAQAEVDAPAVSGDSAPSRSLFWRKVSNVEDLCDGLVTLPGAGQQSAARVRVVEDKKLSPSDYDKFTADFFASQSWLDGKGGIDEDGTRHVIQVTAQDRQTLHIDPQGHDYARYVGIPEADVQRVVGSRSFVVAEVQS